MDYYEAIESKVTRLEAKREIELHSLRFVDFVVDVGSKDTYKGSEVLDWLGY